MSEIITPPVVTPPVVPPVVVPDAAQAAAAQAVADGAAAAAATQAATLTKNEGAVKTAEQIAADAALKVDPVYTLALPKDAVIETSAVERLTAFAKANTLAPETAQKVLDLANAEVAADRTRQQEANVETFQTMARETWPNEIKADKEFGGDKFDATIANSKRAAEIAWTPEERKILNETGWGNHPLLVKGMARLGSRFADDKLVMGGDGGGGIQKPTAQILFPSMPNP